MCPRSSSQSVTVKIIDGTTHSVRNATISNTVTEETTREYIVYSPVIKKKRAVAVSVTRKIHPGGPTGIHCTNVARICSQSNPKVRGPYPPVPLERLRNVVTTRGVSSSPRPRGLKRTVQAETYVREEIGHVGIICEIVKSSERLESKVLVGA